jgi:glycosyltransferase involved in cell wall biosynthesis
VTGDSRCPISVVIIAQDQADRIEACVRSCRPFADEVLVIDGGSTDGTREVAERLGCRVVHNEWPGYAAQRNFGAGTAAHDWVFSIDTDEVVDATLAAALADFARGTPPNSPAFAVQRVNNFIGEWLTEKPETIVRLYDRRRAAYGDATVHETVNVPKDEAQVLPGSVWHRNNDDLTEVTRRLNLYTSLEADRDAARRDVDLWRLFWRPVARFGQRYFLHRGYRYGWRGLFLALHWTYWELLREMKVFERRRPKVGEEPPT